MQIYKTDLHIHTALSPCASDEMTPPKIIHAARAKGLSIIAVTDHNTAENTAATIRAAEGSGIFVIPGMEIQTREEAHMICLFPDITACLKMQELVYKNLPPLPNRKELFGPQYLMDSFGSITGELDRMLLVSVDLSVEAVVHETGVLGGICIPAHVDRPSYSLLTALGFIPPDLNIHAVELSKQITSEEAALRFSSLNGYRMISSSDAHCLSDIGCNSTLIFSDSPPDFKELIQTLCKSSGRKVLAKMKDLSMHIIDIVQNSIEAGAVKIQLLISEDSISDTFTIEVSDNGRGMDQDQLSSAADPFFTTRKTRRIGLGLPLLKAAAERCEGHMTVNSTKNKGTTVFASFRCSHIDRAPLGNIIDTLVNIIAGNPDLNLNFIHRIDDKEIVFDAHQLKTQLEDIPLNNPAVLNWIRKYLNDSYNEMRK